MITTVVYGYLTRALRPDRYNALDDFVLDTFGWPKEQDEAYARRRVIAIEKFILSLSDQQLVTGISLIIANYLIRFGVAGLNQRVSAYSYVIAVHLALLSCVIHLSSLTILRDHFDAHTRLRSFRICLILPAIGFLLPKLVLAQDIDSSVTLSCGLDSLHTRENKVLNRSHLAQWDPDIQNVSTFLQTVAILIIIAGGYIRRVIEVYFPLFRKAPDVWTARVSSKFIGYPKRRDIDLFMARSCEAQITSAARLVNFRGHMKQKPVVAIAGILVGELRRSFFTEIVWLLFYTAYSLSSLIFFFLWGGNGDQSTVTFTPSFGQILPLMLLAATGLSITEAFGGEYELCHTETSSNCIRDEERGPQLESWSHRASGGPEPSRQWYQRPQYCLQWFDVAFGGWRRFSEPS